LPEKPNGSKMASSKCRWPELSPSPLIIAHRGASGVAPENTCLALDTAINLGADMVEVDVQMSRDGCPVIFHDAHLARTVRSPQYARRALKALRIGDLSATDIKHLDVGSWKSRKFAGLSIPTLAEFLLRCGGRVALNLELKIENADGTEAQRHALIDRLGDALTVYPAPESVLISSFDRNMLELARAALPQAWLGILPQPGGVRETFRLAGQLHAISVHLPCADIRTPAVNLARESGFRLFAYTANSTFGLRRLIAAGVDGIFTNYPDRLHTLLRQDMPHAKQ